MQKKRVKFDRSRPDTRQIVDSIVHGAATTEGTMVAFPTCFPGVTTMLPPDESRIRAMDVAAGGIVYAGTSGRQCHLLVGMFHGVTGVVFDMGVAEGATECVAMCCGQKRFLAAVNGRSGGRLVARDLQPLPFDLIQEWHISRSAYRYLDGLQPGERCVHAVADSRRATAVVATDRRLLTVDLDSLEVRPVAELACTPRLALGSGGAVLGRDADNTLWRFTVKSGKLARKAVRLPSGGTWDVPALKWARDWSTGVLYTVDARGRVFSFSEKTGFSRPLATVPLQPTGAMAVTTDGRLYVSAGDGIGRVYCVEPGARAVKDLGVAVSVIQRRRYGYQFGDAVVGRDGEIVFGEDDDAAHVWLYFPRIARPSGGKKRGRSD